MYIILHQMYLLYIIWKIVENKKMKSFDVLL
jgi:hypothetical protein